MLEELGEKKILILGFGKEGRETLKFLRKLFPNKIFGIADQKPLSELSLKDELLKKNVKLHLGKDYLKALKEYDLIIKSPGIPIHLPEIEQAYRQRKITSETKIFFENCKGKIVGVTATKGKSTTSTLIYKILKAQGLKVHLVGNIGKPVLSFLLRCKENDIFVFELSSHQLYDLKTSPHVAVFLNIYPEHLDYYKDFQEYLMAKANICLWQTEKDYLIYNAQDKNVSKVAKLSRAKKIPITPSQIILKKLKIKKFPFAGKFYCLNIAAAAAVGQIFGAKSLTIKKVIENFKPLPHRLEYVGKFKGIEFYNDSLSTIPETTIAALDSLGKRVETLILGGFDRGLDFKKLAKEILKRKIKNLILFPQTGDKIWRQILSLIKDDSKLPKAVLVQNMKDAVKLAFEMTQKGKICLLSPASPSFGLFRDYRDRGNLFKKYVKYYGKKS